MTSGSRRAKSTWKPHQGVECGGRVVAGRVHDGPTAGEQSLADADEQRGQHRLLAGEVAVDGRPADADRRAEVLDRDAVEAAVGEQPRGGRQQRVAALGLGAAAGGRDGVDGHLTPFVDNGVIAD